MSITTLDLSASLQVEKDGTHTVLIQISGMRSLDQANMISHWAHTALKQNIHKIGERDPNPPRRS